MCVRLYSIGTGSPPTLTSVFCSNMEDVEAMEITSGQLSVTQGFSSLLFQDSKTLTQLFNTLTCICSHIYEIYLHSAISLNIQCRSPNVVLYVTKFGIIVAYSVYNLHQNYACTLSTITCRSNRKWQLMDRGRAWHVCSLLGACTHMI